MKNARYNILVLKQWYVYLPLYFKVSKGLATNLAAHLSVPKDFEVTRKFNIILVVYSVTCHHSILRGEITVISYLTYKAIIKTIRVTTMKAFSIILK
jgi:hypothetical protein